MEEFYSNLNKIKPFPNASRSKSQPKVQSPLWYLLECCCFVIIFISNFGEFQSKQW
jgi:hypothetical protein